ncbi:MAG: ATP-binding cassette domain-containing protein, partial [Coriobacteriales bacterium]|nr:ATP-binding cassette domain-containing protein [Coriobacteriales bacterium]
MLKTIQVSGSSAVGKTAVIKSLLPQLQSRGEAACVAKIDCLHSDDGEIYSALGIPCVVGLSEDICPDHFLVSNLCELWQWASEQQAQTLIIETAGLCHRCSPATVKTVSICVVDCTASSHAPMQLGPMLSLADIIILTKIDLVSQAEREIISASVVALNPKARLFAVDGLVGYGIEPLAEHLCSLPATESYEGDYLRFTMPSGVCSYCVGEQRVGSAWQQGAINKIDFTSRSAKNGVVETDADDAGLQAATKAAGGEGGATPEKPLLSQGFEFLEVCPGHDKDGKPENFAVLTLRIGELYTIVGNTGAGKSRLIKDIEQLVKGDSATGREIRINGKVTASEQRPLLAANLIAHLSQNMRFSLDLSVEAFVQRHLQVRGRDRSLLKQVIELANRITSEPLSGASSLHELSGGQGRALMIADIALVCDSPIVLIDEIENAGINKEIALSILTDRRKLVLIATHDIQTALMAQRRIVLGNGALVDVVERKSEEAAYYQELQARSRCQD